jgi:hypothetical protein
MTIFCRPSVSLGLALMQLARDLFSAFEDSANPFRARSGSPCVECCDHPDKGFKLSERLLFGVFVFHTYLSSPADSMWSARRQLRASTLSSCA